MAAPRAGVRQSPPCYAEFPGARSMRIGKTIWYNRQDSVRMVVCYGFGLNPSADFPVSAEMVCGLVAQAIGALPGGKTVEDLSLYADGTCSAASLAADRSEPAKYIGIACGWASDLLGAYVKPLGVLGSLGCTFAPSAGHSLGGIFESGHELGVAKDVEERGKCIKYSPTHFGSPWLAIKCAKGDPGFTDLPLAPRGGGETVGAGGGGAGKETGHGGTGSGSTPGPPPPATCEDSGCAGGATTPIGNVSALAGGGSSPCALIIGGKIDCWGSNQGGQLGDGSLDSGAFESHPTPVEVSGIRSATQVSVSGDHTCAVVSGGNLYCWGLAAWGQLGNESESPWTNDAPIEATTTHEATQVSAGDDYTCVIVVSGHVECWGYNAQGELGDGTTNNSFSAVAVSGLSGVTDLASGEDANGTGHTCAITAGGVYCWGDNREGQLGDGTVKDSDTPVKVTGIIDAVSVTAGEETTCALLATGSIECWGYNAGGALGDGTTENSTTPTIVQGITNATSVSAGQNVTCAALATHIADCWGFGDAGALGNGRTVTSTVPVQVSGLTDVASVAAGYSMGCAVRLGGGVDCWGGDVFGQLGNGAGGAGARGFSAFPLAVAAP